MFLYSREKARRSLIDTVAFRAISQVATVFGYVVMVRSMPEGDFGVFNLLYAFIPVVSTIASLGLEQTLRRYQPEYLRAGNTAAAAWLVRFVASARFGTNVICLGLMLLAWNYFAPLFKLAEYRSEFALFSILILLHFQAGILQLALGSRMLHRYAVGSTVVLSIAKLVGYGAFAWFDTLTLERAVLTDTIGYALAYALMRFNYHAKAAPKLEGRFRPDWAERKRMLRYGLLNNFNDLGTFALSTKLDQFFVAAFIDPIAVGIYAFYSRLNGMVINLLPVHLFGNVIQPMFFAMPPNQADERAPRYFSLLINMNLLIQWPVLAFTAVYHAEFIDVVFGGRFIQYSWLLPIVVLFSMLNVISVPATLVAQYEEKAGIILLSKVFAIYNVVALLVMVPWAGVLGALLAGRSAETLKNFFIWWHVRRRARWLEGARSLLVAFAIWGSVAGILYVLKSIFDISAAVHLALGSILCCGASLLHLRSPAISISDRELLDLIMRGKERRILNLVGLLGRSKSTPESK
jgi:O-antigen/teichoic acid export membrane protein